MTQRKQILLSWEKNAENWIQAVRGGSIPNRKAGTDKAIVDAILRCAPKRLLDVGCGEGWLVRSIVAKTVCEAVGIDASQRLIRAARAADPKSRYEVLNYDDLLAGQDDLGDGFDVIAFNYALFDDAAASLLGGLKHRLSPGGAMIIQSLNPGAIEAAKSDAWRIEGFASFEGRDWTPMPWFFRTVESWRQVIEDAGLTLRKLSEPTAGPEQPALSLLMVCKAD
jgi:2-polyprenyl-3-methyl-5-hydroxy-6-metoxy-1,4-benzoquinol methylase